MDKFSTNPYRPGGPVRRGELFVGRDNEFQQILQSLERNISVSISGERRIGKTSLLFRVQERLAESRNVYYLSLETITDEDDFQKWLAGIIQLEKWETYTDFENKLREVSPILLLDEFDKTINHPGFSEDFFNVLRAWSNQDLLSLVVSTRKRLAEINWPFKTSPFGNTFVSIVLDVLNYEEAARVLDKLDDFVGNWKSDWKEEVLRKTNCHPWKLQLFGFYAWNLIAEKGEVNFQEALNKFDQETVEKRVLVEENKHPMQKKSFVDFVKRLPTPIIAFLLSIGTFAAAGGLMIQSAIVTGIGAFILFVVVLIILFR
jgi:AAA+ ATPase superfamily predicted ATPase